METLTIRQFAGWHWSELNLIADATQDPCLCPSQRMRPGTSCTACATGNPVTASSPDLLAEDVGEDVW